MRHTPGPWQWYWRENPDSGSAEADCGVFWEKRPGHAYSVCRAPRYEKQEQWEANARLIAAAPDLLKAFRWAMEQLSWAHPGDIGDGDGLIRNRELLKRLEDL